MKLITLSAICTFFFASCQKEISHEVLTGSGQTDTSLILTIKRLIYPGYGTGAGVFTYYRTYRNNTISGKKGYIISDTNYNTMVSSKAVFKYDNKERLTDIIHTLNGSSGPGSNTRKITWTNDLISNI